jgi:hypothetical protein
MRPGIWGTRIVLLAVIGALVAGATALASGSALPVAIKVSANDLSLGQPTRVTATAKLPKSAHILIQAFPPGRPATKVVECPRSPCTGTYRHSQEEDVAFQASAIRRAGGKVATLGRSKRVSVFWSEPVPPPAPLPPPPPPPAATPGHYEGTIGNARAFIRFDIGADGLTLTNLLTGEIDESCDPPEITFWFDNIEAPGPSPVSADGSFLIGGSGTTTIEGAPAPYAIKLTGKVSGAAASGVLHVDTSLTLNSAGYSCSSGDQPWTAAKV